MFRTIAANQNGPDDAPAMSCGRQIAFMEGAEERHRAAAARWARNPAFLAALRRHSAPQG